MKSFTDLCSLGTTDLRIVAVLSFFGCRSGMAQFEANLGQGGAVVCWELVWCMTGRGKDRYCPGWVGLGSDDSRG